MAGIGKLFLPEDIVVQILIRLPPKSLMRFQCTCKVWKELISSTSFIAKHLYMSRYSKLASSPPILFKRHFSDDCKINIQNEMGYPFCHTIREVETRLSIYDDDHLHLPVLDDIDVPLPKVDCEDSDPLTVKISGHCDGIVCLQVYLGNFMIAGNAILCNPGLNDFKLLPKSCVLPDLKDADQVSCFDATYWTDCLGFGYDSKGNDYKVVRVLIYNDSHIYDYRAEVYTMRSNSWREVDFGRELSIDDTNDSKSHFLLNGTYYWLQWSPVILSFNMADEVFDEIPLPDISYDDDLPHINIMLIAACKESIALFTFHDDDLRHRPVRSFDMWLLNDLNGVERLWTKQFTIECAELICSPLIFRESDELLIVAADGRLICYNTSTRTFKDLPITRRWSCETYSQAVLYASSIVGVNGGSKLEGIDRCAFYNVAQYVLCTCTSYHGRLNEISTICGGDSRRLGVKQYPASRS